MRSEPRVVLITGASSGIGAACASHLASNGFRVYGAPRTFGVSFSKAFR